MNNWKTKINKINHQDCLELMKEMPDKCVDLIITDPPYLQDSHSGGGAFGIKACGYHKGVDELGAGFDNKILEECQRVSKKLNLYIFCSTYKPKLL